MKEREVLGRGFGTVGLVRGVGRGLEAGERGRRISGGAWLTARLGLGWWAGWVPPRRA